MRPFICLSDPLFRRLSRPWWILRGFLIGVGIIREGKKLTQVPRASASHRPDLGISGLLPSSGLREGPGMCKTSRFTPVTGREEGPEGICHSFVLSRHHVLGLAFSRPWGGSTTIRFFAQSHSVLVCWFHLLMADVDAAAASTETGISLRQPREPMLRGPP